MNCSECLAPLSEELAERGGRCPACGASVGATGGEPATDFPAFNGGLPPEAGIPLSEVATAGAAPEGSGLPPLPPGSKLRIFEATPERLAVYLPGGGSGLGCMVVFGAVFAAVGAAVIASVAFKMGKGNEIAGFAFGALFAAAGCGIAFAGLKLALETTLVVASRGRLQIVRRFLGRERREDYDLGPASNAVLEVAYEQNYQPVYRVRIDGAAKPIKFGTSRTTLYLTS